MDDSRLGAPPTVGDTFRGGPLTVSETDIREFAAQFDPQPFHLDAQKAASTIFGGLAASGWHTAALSMRMIVDSGWLGDRNVGLGVDGLEWLHPVRPGDRLSLRGEVVAARLSKSRPGAVIVSARTETLNQDDHVVLAMTSRILTFVASGIA